MKVCPKCHSDRVEETSYMPIKIVACVAIAIFVPYGILICWLPFLIRSTYDCKNCQERIHKLDIIEIDWRERDKLLETPTGEEESNPNINWTRKQKLLNLEAKVDHLLNKWFLDTNKALHKVIKNDDILFLVKVINDQCTVAPISNYHLQPMPKTLGKQESEIVTITAAKEASIEAEMNTEQYFTSTEVDILEASTEREDIVARLKETDSFEATNINVQYM